MGRGSFLHKNVALIVLFSFLAMAQMAAAPVPTGDHTPAPVSGEDATPGSVEKLDLAQGAKKSPLLPILIGVAAAGALAAILMLVVFKTRYDIRGTWYIEISILGIPLPAVATFSGSRSSGTVEWDEEGDLGSGTYQVSGKNITVLINEEGVTTTYTGEFIGKNDANGTWTSSVGLNGTFTATRITRLPLSQNKPFKSDSKL